MYPLHEVLLLVTCATIASCDDFDDIVAWGKHHLAFLRRFSPFPPRHSLRALAAHARQPRRPAPVRALLRELDRRAVAGPARPHRHRRQDRAAHPRPAQGAQGPAHAQRLRHQRPADAGAAERAGEDQRDHRHPGSARSSGRGRAAQGRAGHHRRHGLPGRDRRQDRRAQGRLPARPERQPADPRSRGRGLFPHRAGRRTRQQDHGREGPRPHRDAHLYRLQQRRLDPSERSYPGQPRFTNIKTIVKVHDAPNMPTAAPSTRTTIISSAPLDIERLARGARATGASRACTGCSMSSSRTTCRATAPATGPRTWPSSAASRSASCAPTRPRAASRRGAKPPAGARIPAQILQLK